MKLVSKTFFAHIQQALIKYICSVRNWQCWDKKAAFKFLYKWENGLPRWLR